MFGIKADWSLDIQERYFTIDDYEGNEARWCDGCGDHAVLATAHRILRDAQLPPEKSVFISGIGCSSRMPHYMATYGLHGTHGRALPLACGVKSRRPELDVWVATGDGDCFSIGAGHWIHAVRYNMDMTILIFDNQIYGLTKKQTSPTSPIDLKTNTHPEGSFLDALNPLTVTLGITNASFVAQVIDWNPPLLYETLKAAHEHKGTSFVRIIQRCPVFVDGITKELQNDSSKLLLLKHHDGIPVAAGLERLFPESREHDPSDMTTALDIARDETTKGIIPVGLLYKNEDIPCYSDLSALGHDITDEDKIAATNKALDAFAI
ncbi:MAG: 2-oxoglutarate oxidoreductase [Thiotrichales bacterium]|mgnify:FL=1|jgi:2-oxoglutarate ferredoxin oxidoreductase subunit beta|nr:2-oxoglutarate oxidoreductase [Thiotrichales bacterium]MBT3613516.1 2-oxoglutarate oxidoreductase [Thiotrichales bacterium]MBT3753015.1 2-oxoglutarate oxidoreductase [Thiotrichales bacterium]MBT3836842.1 2-oxoglutarate oxidoreductase [Thiotrichales bacterium]MBT4151678.1 2-oxoglutarate oxidoreductase [Thiotrichales bacterium]